MIGEVYKWKAQLNLGGHKMKPGEHYEIGHTYAPVLSWMTIRLFLVLAILQGWKTRQLDFVLAYPQAPVPQPETNHVLVIVSIKIKLI